MFWMILVGFAFLNSTALRGQDPCACLPPDISSTDVVTASVQVPGRRHGARVTVRQKLNEIRAHCRKGKLLDARNKPIYFYRLQGCWGNPPADYQEILSQQSKELEKLKKRYHVIEMTCNPTGESIH